MFIQNSMFNKMLSTVWALGLNYSLKLGLCVWPIQRKASQEEEKLKVLPKYILKDLGRFEMLSLCLSDFKD